MTSAGIQPFCKNYHNTFSCFDGKRINPRRITERNISLFLYFVHLCLIWKSNVTSFSQAIEELEINFRIDDIILSDKHVKSFVKNEYDPKLVQSPLTKIVYDSET